MSLYADIQEYLRKVERETIGAVGGVAGSLVALPAASLVSLAEVVQGKSWQQALRDIPATYGSVVDGGERFGRDRAPEITKFVWDMMQEIGKHQAKRKHSGCWGSGGDGWHP